MTRIAPILAASAIAFAGWAHAQHPPAASHAAAPSQMTPRYVDGEVKRVDKEGGKVTIKHGPIPNLDMPAMSMVFRASDPKMLDKVKAGDKVRFKADNVAGALTVIEIRPAN
jgi:Cu/Ag efflux protein CusF